MKVLSKVRYNRETYYYCKSDVGVEGYIKKDKLKLLILNKLVDNASVIKYKGMEVIRVWCGVNNNSLSEVQRIYKQIDRELKLDIKINKDVRVLSNKEKYERWLNKMNLICEEIPEVKVISDDDYRLLKVPDGYGEFVIPDFITSIGKKVV